MRKSIEELLNTYQIRKNKQQKELFIDWLENHLNEYDYEVNKHTYSKKGVNLIIGDVKSAEVILTAHYDTPPNFYLPMISGVSNIFTFLLSQFFMVIPVLIILWIPRTIIFFLTQDMALAMLGSRILLFIYLIQILCGIPNKHNANDNTSGVAVLLTILEDLPSDLRNKVCIVFFDEEEKGLIGASKFKKYYSHVINEKPIINFDCVGNGNHLMFITKKAFRESKHNDLLAVKLKEEIGSERNTIIGTATKHIYTSDQIIFKNSVGVAAVHKAPIFGYYLSHIHSALDKKLDENNIELLSKTMIKFISCLQTKNR